MDKTLFAGYLSILLLTIPALAYSLAPLRDHLRFGYKRTAVICGVSLLLIIPGVSFIAYYTSMSFKWALILALAAVFLVHIHVTTGKPIMRFYCFFNSTMVIGNAMLYGIILAAPLETEDSLLTLRPVTCLVCLAVAVVLGVLYYKSLNEHLPYLLNSEPLNLDFKLALSITVFITLLFFWVMPKHAGVVMTGRVRATILAFLLLAPGAFVLMYHSMWRVAVNLTENSNLRESNELMFMEQKRYEELRSYMDETRTLRHDFRQHLLVIDDYAKNGENEKLSEYISQFTKTLTDHRSVIAANPALDAVASHYDSLANSKECYVKWLIELPRTLPVAEADFITVFGNLVENAILAVEKLPQDKRVVQVNAKMLSDEMLGLTVKNPYEGTIKLNKKGLPRSGKAGHGIGLSSVQAVVDRYSGSLEINTEDNMFTAGVLMYTSGQSE
ncbi:MAG: GHKL domain-containing protein [Mogibacterium sp.]|nr:GHKL domain-containing protein [Mogibacterium sp.]